MRTARFIVMRRMDWRGTSYHPGDVIELHPLDGEVLKEKNVVRDPYSPSRARVEPPERAVGRECRRRVEG
jgi:cation transport regulator ChaC